jgi:nucleotide-binding universal stress UspA family protein
VKGKDVLKKIIVTLDGSKLSQAAIPQAAVLAEGTDAEVLVIEVIPDIETLRRDAIGQFEFTDGDAARIEALAQETHFARRDRARAELETAKASLEAAGVRSVRTEVAEGLAGNKIIDAATREQCDAIVMATRGHGGLGREVVGSVAEFVLRHAGRAAVVLVGPRASE